MNVLSLFDGMSCGRVALDRAGVVVDNYFSSEIDKYAIKVANANWPQDECNRLGDVIEVDCDDMPKIDLIIAGSPCQGFSFSGKQMNFEDPRSKLFFEFVRLIEECQPTYFLLENVGMKKEYENVISELLGVSPVVINSNQFSAQNRKRLYWTNIPIGEYEDRGIKLVDILEDEVSDNFYVSERQLPRIDMGMATKGGVKGCFSKELRNTEKSECLLARDYKGIPGRQDFTMCIDDKGLRKLTPVEYERLQTVPDNYSNCISNTQRYKMLGNGWTVDVIAHIFKGIQEEAKAAAKRDNQ